MVKLRLIPTGKSAQPSYRIVAIDARSKLNGRYIDILGTYNPSKTDAKATINEEKAIYFLSTGAQPTDTVRSLLSTLGIMTKFHKLKQTKKATTVKKTTPKTSVVKNKTLKTVKEAPAA
ncbi:30S ribosomal protein S16 [Spiroplasma endosymbiont of Nebria brevicollis]|uniref:30S ribosomal protein S16 n=1 Tax=Spiroplasma endosymbiont of Nebria brevicollis TaxID=3066284 RepID=UPI00313AF944